MHNPRYDYLPIINRKKIIWPNDGRIALWVAPNIEYFHFDMPIRGSGSNHAPDVPGYTAFAPVCFSTLRFASNIPRLSKKATSGGGNGWATG